MSEKEPETRHGASGSRTRRHDRAPRTRLTALLSGFIAATVFPVCVPALASGPPETTGHLDIEPLGDRVRVTLQLPYAVVRQALGVNAVQDSEEFNEKLFRGTLGEKPLLSQGASCEWGPPVGIISFVAIRIQSEAHCEEQPGQLGIELPFLKSLPEDFRLGVKVHGPSDPASPDDMSRTRPDIALSIHRAPPESPDAASGSDP